MKRTRLTICATCQGGAGRDLARRVEGLAPGLAELRLAECLLSCGRPLALAVGAPGKATYVFAGVDAATSGEDLAAFLRLFAASPDGEVADARPCGALRFRLMARLPP